MLYYARLMLFLRSFPNYRQSDQMDCGPTCLRIIARHYGRDLSIIYLREISFSDRQGSSLFNISEAAETIGFQTIALRTNVQKLIEAPLPCILFWDNKHFTVLYKISRKSNPSGRKFHISDPAKGLVTYDEEEFIDHWSNPRFPQEATGIALLLSNSFVETVDDKTRGSLLKQFWDKYLKPHLRFILQLCLGLFVASLLQLIIPILTKLLIDKGITSKNLNLVFIIVLAQFMLIVGRLSIDFTRSWILLHITARINISVLTDFLIKMMKLPMNFFESRMTADILRRIADQRRIESFLSGRSLNTLFSTFNLVVYSFVLGFFNIKIFSLFALTSIAYLCWLRFFLRKRRDLDFKQFDIDSDSQSHLMEIVNGIQEIKLSNAERQKRWQWEKIQSRLFNFNIRTLKISQLQQTGTFFFNEVKNLIITVIAAKYVIEGKMTLGTMMSIQYMIGQLNNPIEQIFGFMQQFQEAKISLERISEVHELEEEQMLAGEISELTLTDQTIQLKNLTYMFSGVDSEPVLRDINLTIPKGEIIAIVGASGSGKTTLLKLLIGFYRPKYGEIRIGKVLLEELNLVSWRNACGVVLQEGFIFSDTISGNIALGDDHPDQIRIMEALDAVNLREYVLGLPQGLETRIGGSGIGMSQGQRQRMQLARMIYKKPDFIFLDEATNALDATNEMLIMKQFDILFKRKTVVMIAHRLSTIRNAHKIVVLDKGTICEEGNHNQLIAKKGIYFKLVQDQLKSQ